jgi:exonuclease SbcD
MLRTIEGTVAELAAMADDVGDAWLRVRVHEPARAGLADDVRALLPRAVDVQIARPAVTDDAGPVRAPRGLTAHELFGAFLAREHIAEPRVERLFARLFEDELQGADA